MKRGDSCGDSGARQRAPRARASSSGCAVIGWRGHAPRPPTIDSGPLAHALRSRCRLHAMWLRDNCACADCTNQVTREQKIDLLDIDDGIAALDAGIDDSGGLWVRWNSKMRNARSLKPSSVSSLSMAARTSSRKAS